MIDTKKLMGIATVIVFVSLSHGLLFGFPSVYPTGMTIYKPEKSYEGYTIYYAAGPDQIEMIDMSGDIQHFWEMAKSFGKSVPKEA